MDNPEELYYESLEEQYLQECSKFNTGDVVYFEHKNEQDISTCMGTITDKSIKVSIGIIVDKSIKKIIKSTIHGESRLSIICYDIITPKGMFENISECKITSASQFIFREYLKQQPR